MSSETTSTTVRVPTQLHKAIRVLGIERRRTLTDLAVEALRRLLAEEARTTRTHQPSAGEDSDRRAGPAGTTTRITLKMPTELHRAVRVLGIQRGWVLAKLVSDALQRLLDEAPMNR